MERVLPYIIAFIITSFAVFPPIEIRIPMVSNVNWVWLVLIAGSAGLYLSFTKINIFVKTISIFLFVSCFFSSAPLISFTAYISIIPLIYFYLACTRIEDWTPVKRALIIIVTLSLILFAMQKIGRDNLLNFGLKNITCQGTVGNPMQLKSLMIITLAVLMAFNKPRRRYLVIGWLSFLALFGYLAKANIISNFFYARGAVWFETIKLYLQHPVFGWGPAMFKTIFPALAHGCFELEGAWRTAHNCWLQLLFETGAIGFLLAVGFFIYLFIKLWQIDKHLFTGLTIIVADMLVHFPTRQIQCVPIILMFLAHCDQKIRKGFIWQPQSLR